MSESPNSYSTHHYMTTCGSDAGLTTPEHLAFGFAATALRVFNSCGDRVFFNLQTSATTGDDFIAGCSAVSLTGLPPFGGLSLKTTSTSTGAGLPAARPIVGISAWASA